MVNESFTALWHGPGMRDVVSNALVGFPGAWQLLEDYQQPRLRLGATLLLVSDRAVLVFARDRAAASAAATALADFHAGCRDLPVLPVALLTGERVVAQDPLPFPGAGPVIACTRLLLPGLLARVAAFVPRPGFDLAGWAAAPYRPVPGLMQAACDLFARHDAAALLLTSSGRGTLERTRAAIAAAASTAEATCAKHLVFVTGAPGAGKTICGLEFAFGRGRDAVFLTANPALLHVLRAALVQDATGRGLARSAARQRVHAVVQPLHGFRDQYARDGVPAERILVIDEAQRCWTTEYACRKTRNKPVPLHLSEPGHILDAMGRRDGHALIVCLIGGGQEIHAGEGGMAEWAAALAAHPDWQATAPPSLLGGADARQHLPDLPTISRDSALHLGDPIRTFQAPHQVAWADAVLSGDAAQAGRLTAGLPVRLTRSLPAMRAALQASKGRAGLVASAGGRRLGAEGLGGLLWHQDEDAVARWFLQTWPDIRSSDALEVAATEFGIQGLELDHVGLCWDQDLTYDPGKRGWIGRAFRATNWTKPLAGEPLQNKLNTYRVLLTRARRQTIIWCRGAMRVTSPGTRRATTPSSTSSRSVAHNRWTKQRGATTMAP